MKTIILLFLLTLTARATVIPVDLGPSRVLNTDLFVSTTGLSGTKLQGQTISLDYQFSRLVHLFSSTDSRFYVAIRAQTNMAPMPNTLYPSVIQAGGYAVGLNGFQGPSLSLDMNSMVFGPNVTEVLFGLAEPFGFFGATPHDPVYLSGMHFDLTLPDIEGVEITGLTLHFDTNATHYWNGRWALTGEVPETGSTVSLFVLALLALFGLIKMWL